MRPKTLRAGQDDRAALLSVGVVFFLACWIAVFFTAKVGNSFVLGVHILFLTSVFFAAGVALCVEFKLRPIVFLYAMVVGFCLQNVFLAFVAGDSLTRLHGQVLIGMKSVYVAALALTSVTLVVIRRRRFPTLLAADIVGGLMIVYVSAMFVMSDYPLMSRITNVRNFLIPVVAFMAVRLLTVNAADVRGFVRFLLNVAMLLAVIGWAERFFISDDVLFRFANLEKVTEAKIGLYIIPGTLWTNLGEVQGIRRLISVFYEPINAGYFFAAVSVTAFAFKRYIYAVLLSVTTVLTFAKGGWALLLAGCGVLLIQRLPWKSLRTAGYLTMAIGYAFGVFLTVVVFPSSSAAHVVGLVSGLATAVNSPFGGGLGSGGYFSWMYGVHVDPTTARQFGGDSGIGSIGQQLGGVGILLFVTWLGLALRALSRTYRANVHVTGEDGVTIRQTTVLGLALLVGLLLNSIVQENALSIYANYLIMIFAALGLSIVPGAAPRHVTDHARGVLKGR